MQMDLRLALPRALHVVAYGEGGAAPAAPLNPGWPDVGVELAATLLLPAAAATASGGRTVEVRGGAGKCLVSVPAAAGGCTCGNAHVGGGAARYEQV